MKTRSQVAALEDLPTGGGEGVGGKFGEETFQALRLCQFCARLSQKDTDKIGGRGCPRKEITSGFH